MWARVKVGQSQGARSYGLTCPHVISETAIPEVNKYEYLVPFAATLSLFVSCILISNKKFFWNDEFLSFYLLNDTRFVHMLQALSDTINNAPPLYFVLGWHWAGLFSASELSLRLFSSLAIAGAFFITWLTLRRTYELWASTIAALSVFGLSPLILYQNAEARFYGLLLAACALGWLHYDYVCRRERCGWAVLLAGSCIHAVIIQTHLFGFAYSGAILLALMTRDWLFGINRPKIYLSLVLGWLSFVPWISAFLAQSDLARPRAWIPVPYMGDLLNSLNLSSFFGVLLLGLSGVIVIANARDLHLLPGFAVESSWISAETARTARSETGLLLLAYSFLAVPVLVWVVSRTFQPIFVDRYMIPSQLSSAILMAATISRVIIQPVRNVDLGAGHPARHGTAMYLQSLILVTLSVVLLLGPIAYAAKFPTEERPGAGDIRYGHRDLPVAVEFSHRFLPRFHYSPEGSRYVFILDWELALQPESGLFPPGEYKTMDALRRHYRDQFKTNIVESEQFLGMHQRFLVLDSEDTCTARDIVCPRWFEVRVENNPLYKVKQLGRVQGMNLVLVEANQ